MTLGKSPSASKMLFSGKWRWVKIRATLHPKTPLQRPHFVIHSRVLSETRCGGWPNAANNKERCAKSFWVHLVNSVTQYFREMGWGLLDFNKFVFCDPNLRAVFPKWEMLKLYIYMVFKNENVALFHPLSSLFQGASLTLVLVCLQHFSSIP